MGSEEQRQRMATDDSECAYTSISDYSLAKKNMVDPVGFGIFRIAVDDKFTLLYSNEVCCVLFGRNSPVDRDEKESLSMFLADESYKEARETLLKALEKGEESVAFRLQIETNSNGNPEYPCYGCFVHGENGKTEMVGFIQVPTDDICPFDEQKMALTHFSEITHIASKDPLTGALNRRAIEQQISQTLLQISPNETSAMFMIDLDDFKRVNDQLGHRMGDKILIRAVSALRGVFQPSDFLGRLGGDEFVVFMSGEITEDMIKEKASAVVAALQINAGTAGDTVYLTASVGVVIADGSNPMDFPTLYELADKALYAAKRKGKNRCHIRHVNQFSLSDNGLPANTTGTIQLQTLLQYMDEGIALLEFGEKVQLIYANTGFTSLFGFEKKPVDFSEKSTDFPPMIVPADIHPIRTAVEESVKNVSRTDASFRIRNQEGHTGWFLLKATPVPSEESTYPVVMVAVTDITKSKEQEAALRESSERTRIAFDQTSQILWEVNIPARVFHVFDIEKQVYDDRYTFSDIPKSLLDAGFAHPSSKTAFARFVEDMLSGKKNDRAVFIVQYMATGLYGWARLSYHTLFDEDGKPAKAIGITEEIPTIFNEQTRFKQEKMLFDSLNDKKMDCIIVNLTKDVVQSIPSTMNAVVPERTSYSVLVENLRQAAFSDDDMVIFKRFSPQVLIEAYAGGTSWVEAEYRIKDQLGHIRWTSCIANLIIEPETRELHAFLIIRDVNIRRRWELSLPSRVERDRVSHLYASATAESMVVSLIQEKRDTNADCFLALVDIKGLSQISEDMGQGAVEQIRFSIGRLFRILLDSECVIGQLSEERILLFWPEALSGAHITNLLEETTKRARETSNMPEQISLTIGTSSARCSQADYEGMYSRAAYVCAKNRSSHLDIIVSFEDFDEDNRLLVDMNETQKLVTANPEETLRPLTPDEKETILTCFLKLAPGADSNAVMPEILNILGMYYDADRVYQLTVSRDNKKLNAIHEWLIPGKHSLMKQFADLPVDKVYVIKEALEKRRTILLLGPLTWAEGPAATSDEKWRFICVPVQHQERISGFLCIENPKKHYADTALLSTIMPFLPPDRNHLDTQASSKWMDSLTGLFDWNSYVYTLQTLDVEVLNSLGVLRIEINGLDRINEERGYEYGTALLVFVAETLLHAFPHENVFRASVPSFAVIYCDITYAGFHEKCKQVQAVLDKQYPGRFRLGYTWSDKGFTVAKLVEHAENIMRLDKQPWGNPGENDESRHEAELLATLKAAISEGHYTVYIQPKTRLSSGEVLGGEALVRYQDPIRGIVPPAEFIDHLERHHVIRELDFHVLDRTLGIMQEWKKRGSRLVPVSVNFSRQTLLDRSALAAVLAIHSRYDIPANYIEIEITETIGNMERRIVADAVGAFREQGFLVSLDDFGSEYSSITMLSDIPFDSVKLDKSIIADFVTNQVSRAIVESMVRVCGIMGAVCIAEGVETAEQVKALMDVGCDYAQGYFYNKPIPADDFEEKYLKS